ncbi:MAG: alpha/beta fold hydrolase [Chloroflexota bacterium]
MIAETESTTPAEPTSDASNLTKLQFLYWISQVMRPDAAFLNTLIIFDLPGTIDTSCFELAFEAVVNNSDSLRTVIVEQDGTPHRIILDQRPAALEQLDLSGEAEPLVAFESWLAERARRPFTITEALYDTVLVKLADDHYRWYINQHHIIADAQAFFATFNYLKTAYETAVSGQRDITLDMPAYQTYVDYELNFRESKRYEKAGQYWDKKLNPGPNPVRFNGVAPAKRGASVTQLSVDLGTERSKKLSEAALGKNVFTLNEELSTYNLLAALFFIQLQTMTQNDRLGVVTPVHNRTTDEFRGTVGLFMEMCPLQLTLGEEETFDSVIKKMRKETRSTMPQAQYGSALSLPGETFDVMFNMHQVPEMSINDVPVGFRKYHPGFGSESFACHIHQYMDNGRFLLHLDFHDDLFTAEQRQETADQFVALIDAFLEDSSQSLNLTFTEPLDLTAEEEAADNTNRRPDYEAPRDAMENQMSRLWEEVLGVQKIGIHDDFFDSGGSSFLASKLFLRVQEVMGQKLPLSTLLEAKTVAQMVATMRAKSEGKLWSKTVTMKPGKEGSQALFFVPGAGGSLIRLDALMGLLDDDLRVVAFQLPGVDDENGRPFPSIEAGASYFIDVMREIQPEGPYRITGYSWGGMIAFNMAVQLVQAGHEVEFLAIIDTPAQNPNFQLLKTAVSKYATFRGMNQAQTDKIFLAVRDKAFRLEYFIRSGFRALNQHGVGYVTRLGVRKANSLAKKFTQRGPQSAPQSSTNSTKPAQNQSQQSNGDFWSRFNLDKHRLQFVRTNDRSIRLYIPQSYPGKAYLFQSSKGYRNPLNRSASPQLGWGAVIRGGVDSQMIPGDHLGMLVDPNVKVLAEKLQQAFKDMLGENYE